MLPSRKLLSEAADLKGKIKKARKIQQLAGQRVVHHTAKLRQLQNKLNPS